jgi:hypothetical protein
VHNVFLTSYVHDLYTYIIFAWYKKNSTSTKSTELIYIIFCHNFWEYNFKEKYTRRLYVHMLIS